MAFACMLGMLIGMSPYIGFQTMMAVAGSMIFRVPVYPLVIGAYLTNPITIPPIFAATTKFGIWLLGTEVNIPITWDLFTWENLMGAAKQLFWPFMIGTHVAGIVLAIPTYFISYYFFARYRRRKELMAKQAEENLEGDAPEQGL